MAAPAVENSFYLVGHWILRIFVLLILIGFMPLSNPHEYFMPNFKSSNFACEVIPKAVILFIIVMKHNLGVLSRATA
jgi:hypothetical protein